MWSISCLKSLQKVDWLALDTRTKPSKTQNQATLFCECEEPAEVTKGPWN